jgi:two-component system CheB/CheR fusion protein
MTRKKDDIEKPKQTIQAYPSEPVPSPHLDKPGHDKSAARPKAKPSRDFPIVGIGASAGGLGAFEAFFSGMPADVDPGMAFVLVQHLAPAHKSILAELIRRYTRMRVFEVKNGMVVKPNCAYIIPPNRDMALLHGRLHLMEPSAPRGLHLPIDLFFNSLAQDLRERAICIVLSGTGTDGTMGVRAIKGEGGMVIAQNLDSAEYDGMPRSAIATGLVDYELPPAEMPAQLMTYVAHAFSDPPWAESAMAPKTENAFKKIFILLRTKTGHDFSQYKMNTIHRRIERRMAIQQVDTIEGYVSNLQENPTEVEALFGDLLIGVTHFFRDPEAFKALEEQVIPNLFAGKHEGAGVRVWSPGCSTGEEAYSLAILMQEHLEAIKQSNQVQVFATDLDSRAIAKARTGLYPLSIAADISPERLSRFFTIDSDGSAYRIHKSIRDMVVFSVHNLIKDPPFSRLDLISCRNLLIYLGGDLQKKLIPLFHYALNPGGFLFQGTSETVGGFGDLFEVLDRKAKLYYRKEDIHDMQRMGLSHILPPITGRGMALKQISKQPVFPVKQPLRELIEQVLLQQVALAGALVNDLGDILYLYGRTGKYFELPAGATGTANILKMAREGLRRELTTALHKATSAHEIIRCRGLRVKTNSDFSTVNLTICPVTRSPAVSPEVPLYVVILEAVQASESVNQELPSGDFLPSSSPNAPIAALKHELLAQEEYLKVANEELETSNEELKSTNEEMQSSNEEFQSSNEELETSKEELQSVNEELATVNNELQIKLNDLSRSNNDMNNLLAGTGIGTVFVDHQLRILRFTPAAAQIINLILSDVGRPLGHVVANLAGYDCLVSDVHSVLSTLAPKEVNVQTTEDRWYTMRIQPYRTLDNVIEGAVITFVDITEMERIRDKLRKANDLLRLAVVVRDANDAITMQDLDGNILAWNPGAVRIYGWSESEALVMNVRDRIPKAFRKDALAKLHQLSQAEILEPYLTHRIAKDGSIIAVSITSTALMNETKRMYAIATTERPRDPKVGDHPAASLGPVADPLTGA